MQKSVVILNHTAIHRSHLMVLLWIPQLLFWTKTYAQMPLLSVLRVRVKEKDLWMCLVWCTESQQWAWYRLSSCCTRNYPSFFAPFHSYQLSLSLSRSSLSSQLTYFTFLYLQIVLDVRFNKREKHVWGCEEHSKADTFSHVLMTIISISIPLWYYLVVQMLTFLTPGTKGDRSPQSNPSMDPWCRAQSFIYLTKLITTLISIKRGRTSHAANIRLYSSDETPGLYNMSSQ